MKIIDLSHEISDQTPFYPGTEAPVIETANTFEKDGFREKKISMFSHTGTHIDAPAHILSDGKTLEHYTADYFYGKAFIIDVSQFTGEEIPVNYIANYKQKINASDFIIFHSGWSKKWGSDLYFKNFPVLSKESAESLVNLNLRGIGIDMISVDPVDSFELPIHHIILRKQFIIIENLTNLDLIPNQEFTISCLPLKIKNADGAPARVVAIIG